MKHNILSYLLYFLLIILLLPLSYGHEEGAQTISKESLIGPLYAFLIITSAAIIARFIKKSNINKTLKEVKKRGRKK